jgi:hypothetical protein
MIMSETIDISVEDPGCLSRIMDLTIFWYPESQIRPSFILDPDPGSGFYKLDKGKVILTFFMKE